MGSNDKPVIVPGHVGYAPDYGKARLAREPITEAMRLSDATDELRHRAETAERERDELWAALEWVERDARRRLSNVPVSHLAWSGVRVLRRQLNRR
jgi:hypothetical protein